jgi:ketosteroid isomerase-like protein
MDAGELIRHLYEAYQARDWDRAQACLHPDAAVALPATAERLTGRAEVMRFQREYPEPWGELAVLRVVAAGAAAAAEVAVTAPDGEVYRMAAFWQAEDGLLRLGTEYWIDPGGQPPPGREDFRDGR